MHDAAKEVCEPGENCGARLPTETNRLPFPTWTVRQSHFFYSFFFFIAFLIFCCFLTYHTTEKGGATERRLRDGCAREECGRVVDG
jgi:hypothetical protein